MMAAAKIKFTDDLAERLGKFMKDIRDKKIQRNAVAHGIWGVSDSYRDALIHMELEDVLNYSSFLPTKGGYYVGEPGYNELAKNQPIYRA